MHDMDVNTFHAQSLAGKLLNHLHFDHDGLKAPVSTHPKKLDAVRETFAKEIEKTLVDVVKPYLDALYEIDAAIPFDANKEWSQAGIDECLVVLKKIIPRGCPDDRA
jgi:hypothetical protein